MPNFKFKELEKKPLGPKKYPTGAYEQMEKERALSQSIKPKKELKEKTQAKKIDFNGTPAEVLKYPMMKGHNPTIIKLMNIYEDIAGKTYRADKIGLCKAIIYISLQLLHKYESGGIR